MSSITTPAKQKLQFPTPSFCAHRRRNTPREFVTAAKKFWFPAKFSSVLVRGAAQMFSGPMNSLAAWHLSPVPAVQIKRTLKHNRTIPRPINKF